MADKVNNHLANERTFLAWTRTALGLIGLGFVLARMGMFLRELAVQRGVAPPRGIRVGHEFLISGIVFLLIGTILCGWSGRVYHRNRRAIDADRYLPANTEITVLATVVVVGGLTIAALAIWRAFFLES